MRCTGEETPAAGEVGDDGQFAVEVCGSDGVCGAAASGMRELDEALLSLLDGAGSRGVDDVCGMAPDDVVGEWRTGTGGRLSEVSEAAGWTPEPRACGSMPVAGVADAGRLEVLDVLLTGLVAGVAELLGTVCTAGVAVGVGVAAGEAGVVLLVSAAVRPLGRLIVCGLWFQPRAALPAAGCPVPTAGAA